jgi:putative ABC transport system permease protein
MLKNHLSLTFRNLLRRKGYSFINIAGLSIGIASSVIILLFVQHELSYDRHHENAERIYRLCLRVNMQGNYLHAPVSPAPMSAALISDFPEVKSAVRLYGFNTSPTIRFGDRVYIEKNFVYADSTIFDVFTYNMIRGDKRTALNRPNTMVLTESAVRKYFGGEDPMGQILEFGNEKTPYEVTGIIEDPRGNSHFSFDVLASFVSSPQHHSATWISNTCYTYILLDENSDPAHLNARLPGMTEKYLGPQVEVMMGATLKELYEAGGEWGYYLQPLTRIHLYSDLQAEIRETGNITSVIIFSIIALFILVIASINYMNLSTARYACRAKEIGIKKIVGCSRSELINQFLVESVFLSLVSMIIALCLVELFIPAFNNIAGQQLQLHYFTSWYTLPFLIVLSVLVGFLSGSYPAFFLSSFEPLRVLKGRLRSGAGSSRLRGILVVFQFVITIILFVSTFAVYRQMNYIGSKDLGMQPENVIVIHRIRAIPEERIEAFRQELTGSAAIQAASIARSIPGTRFVGDAFRRDGAASREQHIMSNGWVDPSYAEVLGLELVQGRFFSRELASDSLAVVLNETAVRAMGYTDPVGRLVINTGQGGTEEAPEDLAFTIVGVVRDFHFESLHSTINPLILSPGSAGGYLIARFGEGEAAAAIEHISTKWNEFVGDQPLEYSFLMEDLTSGYRAEQRAGMIFAIFAVLAIFIGCLGLLGLASFTAEQRTKEIGIRKAMGASIVSVMVLLSKEINLLLVISTLLAWPVAWYFVNSWLENFAYRVEPGLSVFVTASLVTYFVALTTVSFQAYKSARLNPVDILKDE